MASPNHVENESDSRAVALRSLRTRFSKKRHSISISEKEAELLQEAIRLMEEKELQESSIFMNGVHKPKLLSIVTILGGVAAFSMPAMLIWQTTFTPALIASVVGLLVGIAAVKLDPGMKGYWLHDVD